MTSFILQLYQQRNRISPRNSWFQLVWMRQCSVIYSGFQSEPGAGQKQSLLEMAQKNSRLVLEEKFRLLELDNRKTAGAMDELMGVLQLPHGHRIEAFDHSHIQGQDPVSAMVCFIDGQPNKKEYRKYKLRDVDHADEAASTREVIYRRYSRILKEHGNCRI